MTARTQLEAYLAEFRHRLKALILARGAAVLAVTALVVTLGAVYLGTRQAFADPIVVGARALLLLAVVAAVGLAWVWPLRKLKRSGGVEDIERRAPDFDGRIETYREITRRDEAGGASVFAGLLAEDALKLARRIPVKLKVRGWEISAPAAAAGLALIALVWFAAFGPDNWRYGVRHLWAGWAVSDTLPPQHVAVSPGDGAVRRGGDLLIEATAEGFDPARATVHALFEGAEWESAEMEEADGDAFAFRFFGIRAPLRYYVEAAGVRSPEYRIQVVDLPRVSNVRLTYHYPRWTRLEARTVDPGGDIDAVAGTEVEVEVTTDRPLADASLVVNGERVAMSTAGPTATAVLTVAEEGEYHVATSFNDAPVQLTDNYFIDVQEDNRPVVEVVKPGRDWRASNIEEVLVRVEASDDFNLDRLELNYAINGGEWQVAPLEADGDHALSEEILYLEDMRSRRVPVTATTARRLGSGDGLEDVLDVIRSGQLDDGSGDAQTEPPGGAETETDTQPRMTALEPGDVVSYYVEAFDRGASSRTDLYFIEVQPFDRSFTQSMQAGGGGGGGGGQQNEISQRQKEILVATWNQIREQDEQTGFQDEQQVEDNGALLAELQRTLAEQARTLASRTRARQLTSADEKIRIFVQALESAAEAMDPAAERLADTEFDNAVPSEQAALQHLLRAEAVFTDIQVAFQQGGGGGGGFAGRDLAELFELEMDLEKNQYETEAPVAFDQGAEDQGVDEAIRKLQELARRQENLARQANRRSLTEQERWQQEQLRRETEDLRRELEQLQRQAANQQAGQDQQGQQGQQGQPGQPGQPGQRLASGQSGGSPQGQQTAETLEQLERALQAMDRGAQAGDSGDVDPEQTRRAIEEARRQLDRALERMTAQRQAAAQQAFSDLAERSDALFEEQRETEAALQRVARAALEAREEQGFMVNPLSAEEAYELSERKWSMQDELEALQEDIQRVAQQFDDQTPTASDALQQALGDLQRSQVGARLSTAAYRIRRGAAAEAAALEGVTTSALDDLREATDEALAVAMREAREGVQPETDPTRQLVAELQSLRRALADALPGSQPGQSGQPGQPAASGERQAQAGGAYGGGSRGGGNYDPSRRGLGGWDPRSVATFDPATREALEAQLQDAGSEVIALGSRLRREGLTAEDLEALRQLGTALRGGLPGNPELLEQEYLGMLNLIEKLELQLGGRDGAGVGETGVRTEAPVQVAEAYQQAVAEYYRRLSRAGSNP